MSPGAAARRGWQALAARRLGSKSRGSGHALRVPVSRWLTSSRSASVTWARVRPKPVAQPLPEVVQAVVGVAPVRCPGVWARRKHQVGQRFVQVGEAGVVAGMDPCVRAGQARQERGAAAAVRRRVGAVVVAGAVRGGCLGVPGGGLVPSGRSGLPCGHGRRRPRRRPRSPRQRRPGRAYQGRT